MISTIFFYICVFSLLFIYQKKDLKLLLILFIVLFNANFDAIFGTTKLFDLLKLVEVIEILILGLIIKTKNYYPDVLFKRYVNVTLLYLIVSFAFDIMYYYKGHILFDDGGSYSIIIKRCFKYIIIVLVFIKVSKYFTIKRFHQSIDKAIIIFSCLYSIANIIYIPLLNIGIDLAYTDDGDNRTVGIYVPGDSNTISAVLVMCLGYIIAKVERYGMEKKYYVISAIIILGLIETGSRGGFLGLLGVGAWYLFKNRSRINNLFQIVTIFILFATIFLNFGDKLLDRFQDDNVSYADYDYDPTKYGGANIRFYKWINYMEDIIDNPDYLIVGNTRPKPGHFTYNVHNVFILILYHGGLLFFILYSLSIAKIFLLRKSKNPGSYSLIYLLIPFFIMIVELNDFFYFILPVFILHSYGYKESKLIPSTNVKD
jgi:hypothetical protein